MVTAAAVGDLATTTPLTAQVATDWLTVTQAPLAEPALTERFLHLRGTWALCLILVGGRIPGVTQLRARGFYTEVLPV